MPFQPIVLPTQMEVYLRSFRWLFFAFLLLSQQWMFAQDGTNDKFFIKGQVVKSETSAALFQANVSLIGGNKTVKTDNEGRFQLEVPKPGIYTVYVNFPGCLPLTYAVTVSGSSDPEVQIEMKAGEDASKMSEEDLIPLISVDESSDRSQGGDFISGVLTASRDVFVSTSAFTLGPLRFRVRGMDAIYSPLHINGIPINEIENGGVSWNVWGGLNDVLRDREIAVGMQMASYGLGGLAGVSNMNVRAGNQWKQTRFSSAISNRNYRQRWMFTHNTGWLKNNWAFSFSASFRHADEGYIPGTSYDAWSYFAAAEKRWGKKHAISASFLGSSVKSGLPGGSFQEAYDLAGTNFYNPNWGYQNGVKRNARMRNTHQPLLLINHDWKPNKQTSFQTGLALQTGRTGVSAIDWYNAPDPRPDYYRRLPSFSNNPEQSERIATQFREDVAVRQIDWNRLYQINYGNIETIRDANGVDGNNVTGRRAKYIVEDRRSDVSRANFNMIFRHRTTGAWEYNAGLNAQVQEVAYFKTVLDLLGADFYVNLNQFAERDQPNDPISNQHDMDRPNRILKEGDRFGYDYRSHTRSSELWGQIHHHGKKMDAVVGLSMGATSFKRIGEVKNGLFPENSFGSSASHTFLTPLLKAGLTYKFNGRNYIIGHASAGKMAPQFRNVFVSPRTRDQVASNLKAEDIRSAEVAYLHTSPKFRFKAMAYYATFANQIRTQSFYHDEKRTFVNHTLSGLDSRHMGIEVGTEIKITSTLSATGVVALGDYIYTSRPLAEITEENKPGQVPETERVYLKNFYVSGSPQTAMSAGLSYRSPKYWFLNANINYIDHFYLTPNPLRRTEKAVEGLTPGSPEWNDVLFQEKLPSSYTLDLFGGYSIKANKYVKHAGNATFLYLNIGVSNVLNNLKVITGGFEQMRFDFETKDTDRFPPRYFYSFGRNYFINLTLKF